MKKCFGIIFVILSSILTACGGGGGSPGENISGTIPLSVNLPPGENPIRIVANGARLFKITGGRLRGAEGGANRSYEVHVHDTGIVGLSWAKTGDEDSKDVFVVQWLSGPGETKITVSDADNKEITFAVKTDSPQPIDQVLYTTAPESLVLAAGESRIFSIGGGTLPYTVESANNGVATVQMIGSGQWRVSGVRSGDTFLKFRDSANNMLTIAVKVDVPLPSPLTVSPTELTLPVGLKAVAKISGGQPPYRLAGGIPAAIQVDLSNDELNVLGLLASKLDVTVLDALGSTAKIAVEINAATTGIRFSPNALSISENDTQTINLSLFGAVAGDVCFFSNDPSYLVLTAPGCNGTVDVGGTRSVQLITGTRGNRCVSADRQIKVTAVDASRSIAETIITITDNGICTLDVLAVSPKSLIVQAANDIATPPVTATSNEAVITGGSGAYVVTSDNPDRATATVSGNVITVTGASRTGTTKITIRDQNDSARMAQISVTVN